jgi:hypothetical protein
VPYPRAPARRPAPSIVAGRARALLLLLLVTALTLATAAGGLGAGMPGPLGAARAVGLHTNGASPPPTVFSAAAYDAADGYVVMFGGQNIDSSVLGTTWIFHGGNWTNLTPQLTVAPPARWGASMSYDAADREVLLFGGCPNVACVPALSDTWAFHGGRWSDLTSTLNASPPARGQALMTYDGSGNGSVLLFGGSSGGPGSGWDNDLWAFHAGRWQALAPGANASWPAGRGNGVLAYDPALNEVVLFGGMNNGGFLDDTWTYANATWHNVTAAQPSAPSPRRNEQAAFDVADDYLLLQGGYHGGTYEGDIWSFSAHGWSQLSTANPPPAAYGAACVFDGADNVTLLFSGAGSGGYWTGTWTYSGGVWQLLINPPGTPSNAAEAVVVVVLFTIALVLLLGAFVFVTARANRRRLNGPFGFQPGPTDPVQWVAGGPVNRARNTRQAITLVVLVAVLLLVFGATFAAGGDVAPLLLVPLLVIPMMLVVATRSAGRQNVQQVGIAPGGVIFRRSRSESRIPWNELGIYTYQMPNSGSFRFAYTHPARPAMPVVVAVSIPQAQAIVTSPYAPRWPLNELQARMLGLSARGDVAFPAPSPAGAAGVPATAVGAPSPPVYYNPFPPPGVPGAASPAAPPASPPPAPAYPTAAAAPPPSASAPLRSSYAPLPSAPPPPAAPRFRRQDPRGYRCTTCGHFLPDAAYTFCPTCGAPV